MRHRQSCVGLLVSGGITSGKIYHPCLNSTLNLFNSRTLIVPMELRAIKKPVMMTAAMRTAAHWQCKGTHNWLKAWTRAVRLICYDHCLLYNPCPCLCSAFTFKCNCNELWKVIPANQVVDTRSLSLSNRGETIGETTQRHYVSKSAKRNPKKKSPSRKKRCAQTYSTLHMLATNSQLHFSGQTM